MTTDKVQARRWCVSASHLQHLRLDVAPDVSLADGDEDAVEEVGVLQALHGSAQPLHDGDRVTLQHVAVHVHLQLRHLVQPHDLGEQTLQVGLRLEQPESTQVERWYTSGQVVHRWTGSTQVDRWCTGGQLILKWKDGWKPAQND